ncbi:MAG TPA: Ig-like domain-containing protein, partial [Nitriliruptoraceae bacterium]|nr:Ig-like domain-containing protein [Nitriliruptoraceae bacterium]
MMAMALLAGVLVALPTTAAQAVENEPVVVLLCHGNNQAWPENMNESYFEDLFTETAASESIADYWRDISQGELSIDNSVVVDVEVPVSRDAIGDRDDDDYEQCRDAAIDQGLDMTGYAGLIVFKPQTEGRTVDAIDTDDTTIRVDTRGPSVVADWPSPPFSLVLTTSGSLWNTDGGPIENVLVTAASVDASGIATFTVERGHDDGYRSGSWDPSDWPANTIVKDVVDIYGRTGTLVVPAATSPTIIAHEFGHFLGFAHSRVLSTATTDYGDCFDIMSAASCPSYYFNSSFDFPGGSISQDNGPGMTAILLDREGWLPAADIATFSAPSCDQQTFALRGLGLAGSALQEVRVPVTSQISVDDEDGTVVTSDYLSIELRSRMFPWDQDFPRDAFVLHLKGDDGRAYLVDDVDAGGQRGMVADDTFLFGDDTSDPSDDRYIYVNDIDATAGTGEITIGTCPLQSDLAYTGPVEFTAHTRPEVTAEWSWHDAAAGPSIEVDFELDDADCWDIIPRSEVDDGVGSADCDLDTLTMLPGSYTLTASWDGKDDGFFAPVEDSVEVTVVKRATELDVEVPVDTAYHDRVTLRATLSEAPHPDDASPDGIAGEQVELSIGDGGTAQACTATTISDGTASCVISSVEQVPGSAAVRATFAGTRDYLPSSDVDLFTVTRRATIVDVDVPATTTYHDPVTLRATLEEAPGAAGLGDPVAGRDVELSIGGGATAQACTATTAPDGSVACTIPSVEQVPGSVA